MTNAITAARVEKASKAIEEWALKEAETNPRGATVAHLKMTPEGNPNDTYEEFEWVPTGMAKSKFVPESVRSFGSPWLFRHSACVFRHGTVMHPFSGIGQFLVGVKGKVLVIAWDMHDMATQNVIWDHGMDFFSKKRAKDVPELVKNFTFHCVISPKDTVWIPYAFQCMIIGLPEFPVSEYLMIPFPSARLAADAFSLLGVWQTMLRAHTVFIESQPVKPWTLIGKEFLSWFSSTGMRLQKEAAEQKKALQEGHHVVPNTFDFDIGSAPFGGRSSGSAATPAQVEAAEPREGDELLGEELEDSDKGEKEDGSEGTAADADPLTT